MTAFATTRAAPSEESSRRTELLELALAASLDGVMDWDIANGTIRYGERWKMLLGYEDHELVDSPTLWKQLSHPDDLSEAEALLEDHVENLWPFAHSWRMLHKNGEWRWMQCRAVTIQDDRCVSVRCVSVFTDVTDQVLAQQRLAELTRRNELLLSSAGEGFLGIDQEGVITFANPAAGQLLARDAVSLIGKNVMEVMPHGCPTGRACSPENCPILKPFSNSGINRVAGSSFTRADGSVFTADYSCTPARENDRVLGVVVTFRDVTEQRRIQSQLMQGQKLEAIGQLSAGIAHEINTPLQYVGDNVLFLGEGIDTLLKLVQEYREIIRSLAGEPRLAELVERAAAAEDAADVAFLEERGPLAATAAQDGVSRVRKIVYALKEFSHPGRPEKAPSDLNRAIESTITISASTWKHVATIETALDPALPRVECHLGEINQVVLNLVVNAAHAIGDVLAKDSSRGRGTIRIETLRDGDVVEIRLSDTGGGIPESVRHRIFEPFFTTKEVGRGTGQGLMLARSIIHDRHGGSITFETESGKGTTFFVRLPISAA